MVAAAPDAYQSALDLPSFVELLEQVRAAKLITRFIARDLHQGVKDLERQVRQLGALVDRFYDLLGDRHWIFHDSLDTEEVQAIIDATLDTADTEARFIQLYRDDPDRLRIMIRGLRRFPEMRSRMGLIDKALADYEAGRYYAVVLVLLPVMDGFVNDFDSQRRGLHTRREDEMIAWDSVVGHHKGLSHAHRSFTKNFSRTSSDEVFELHRNGILHGTLLNYDNVVVATKAWNRLFAVADWATSQIKQRQPVEPQPALMETLRKYADGQKNREALEKWKPSFLIPDDVGFQGDAAYRATSDYLTAWTRKNYGRMAELISSRLGYGSVKSTAGRVRDECELWELLSFEITGLDFVAAAACEADAILTFADGPKPARLRWIREKGGEPALIPGDGEWRLYLWGPMAMMNRASSITRS